jgi:hypothetical protein
MMIRIRCPKTRITRKARLCSLTATRGLTRTAARPHYTRPTQGLNAPPVDSDAGLCVSGIDVRRRALDYLLGDVASR